MKSYTLSLLSLILASLLFFACAESDSNSSNLVTVDTGSTESEETTGTSKIILYRSDSTLGGSSDGGNLVSSDGISDRTSADSACAGYTTDKPAGYTNYSAFISFSSSAISDLSVPSSIEIWGKTSKIADNWGDLLDGSIITSLFSAGVLPNSSEWWSGSTSAGTVADNCDNWSNKYASGGASIGNSNEIGSLWINFLESGSMGCDMAPGRYMLCIAY